MTLKQTFILNLKEYRKKEGFSQMKLAEYCDTSPGYIGEIEMGRKFPSPEMIENIAGILRIRPYHLFRDRAEKDGDLGNESAYPLLPNAMKSEIKSQISTSISEILGKY
ncbi:MAG: helix-turn-helix transcriptional regulator [Treponema sp.]|jgi:transcriptional regulator with XRE-family HTH domain|nr:helix-turn-helix transcriptional regulator [Treponema sp.]